MIYPIDPTGISPSNRIIDETKVVMPPGEITDASFFVPRVNPFFRLGLVIKHGARTLIENVDYQLVFRSVALSTHFEKELFGGVMFVNRHFEGTLTISYQVLGGDFQNDEYALLERLARVSGAIRWVTYDQLIGVPSNFPPAYHMHDIETGLVDMGDVVDAVERIAIELGKAPASMTEVNARLSAHLTQANAHSKSQIGLGNIENLAVASDLEVTQGARKYVTADALKKQLPALVAANMPPPQVIPPPANQVPMEHQPTIDKINTLRQDITNVNNALNSNTSAGTTWRAQHLVTSGNPHPQYVTASEVGSQLSGFLDRLTNIENKVNAPPPAAGSGPLSPIKAFWVFHTPGTDRAYQVSGGQPGLPVGPMTSHPSQVPPSYSAIQVTDVKITKSTWTTSSGGDVTWNTVYHLEWVKFTSSFEIDLTKTLALTVHGAPITITKSGNVYSIVLPSRSGMHQSQGFTPISVTMR